MNAPIYLTTDRLVIKPLAITDDDFIFELVNTEGWLRFIGNRNIGSRQDAVAYIQKILNNENILYWMVSLQEEQTPIGLVTFIKRDYLEHHDIGFAFLPRFSKKGYAYEAASAVLNQLIHEHTLTHILATTFPANTSSISLLQKLGLVFEKEIDFQNEKLHVYGAATAGIRKS